MFKPRSESSHGDFDGLAELRLVRNVVGVAVGAQDVGWGEGVPVGELEQRLERRPRVDEDRDPARTVADEVGVREVVTIQASLDEHGTIG
jgi:hypothetical protein